MQNCGVYDNILVEKWECEIMSVLSINDILILDREYIIQDVLSQSEKSNVYKVQDKKNGTFYVIKEYTDSLTDTKRCPQTNRYRFSADVDTSSCDAKALAKKEFEFHRKALHCDDNNSPFLFYVDEFFLYDEKCEYLPYIRIYSEQGLTLHDYFRMNDRHDINTTIAILKAIAETIQSLHKIGVIHLDIKSQNLYILTQGESYWIRILDMGSAQFIGNIDLKTLDLSSGTERFQSPLMFRLSNECSEIGREELKSELSVYDDIYSLCNVMLDAFIGMTYTEIKYRDPHTNVELRKDYLRNDLEKNGFDELKPCYSFIEKIFSKLDNQEYTCVKSETPDDKSSLYHDLVILEDIAKHEGYHPESLRYHGRVFMDRYIANRKIRINQKMIPDIEPRV